MGYNTIVCRQLRHLGVPTNLLGYSYLKRAIAIVIESPDVVHSMTKILYPTLAKEFKTTPSRVERAIRHTVEYVFSNTRIDIYRDYFGNTIQLKSGKLTNTQFISGVAEYIRAEILKKT